MPFKTYSSKVDSGQYVLEKKILSNVIQMVTVKCWLFSWLTFKQQVGLELETDAVKSSLVLVMVVILGTRSNHFSQNKRAPVKGMMAKQQAVFFQSI